MPRPDRRALPLTAAFVAGALAGAAALGATLAWAQGPRMTAQVLLNAVTTELRWARTNVRVNLDTWEPGSETGRHEHPGPAILYVLEGELEDARDGSARTLRAGQVVFNAGRTPHNVRNRGGRVARVLAVHLDPGR